MESNWTPEQFKFEPYELTVERQEEASPTLGPQHKSGRQKRSSIVCQVPGCQVELVSAKTYYKRYRICVHHCNAPAMTIDGRCCRFCQQCGRFHDLSEFEDSRKSCRRKLKRHNERRRSAASKCRKWQSDSGDADSAEEAEAKVVANIKRSSTRPRLARIKQEVAEAAVSKGAGSLHSTSSGNVAARVVPLEPSRFTASLMQPQGPVEPRSLTERLLHGLNGRQTGERGDNAPDSPDFGGFAMPPELPGGSNEGSSVAVPQLDPAYPSALPAAAHQEFEQTLRPSVSAAALQALEGVQLMDMATFEDFLLPEDPSDCLILPTNRQRQQQFPSMANGRTSASYHDLPLAASVDDLPMMALPGEMAAAAGHAGPPAPPQHPTLHHYHYHHQQQQSQQSNAAVPQSVMHAATGLLTSGPAGVPLVGYQAIDRLRRVSLKVFNCTPDELMPAVRAELECLLRSSHLMLEASIRPGCTHVTLSARLDGLDAAECGLRRAIQALLDRNALGSTADAGMIVQSGDELVVVRQRRVVAAINAAQSSALLPHILSVRPLVAVAGQRREVLLAGRHLFARSDLLMCRQQGRNLTVELSPEPAAAGALEQMKASVLGLVPGFAEFEVQRGAFLGAARPLLVLPEEQGAAAAEIWQLGDEEGRSVGGPAFNVDDFLRDAGLVVQYLDRGNAVAAGRAVPRYTRKLLQRIQKMACLLVPCAVARGWAATARLLLPAVTAAGQSGAEAIAAMASACPDGASLLHVAVGTGNAEVARELGAWACAAGAARCLAVDFRGAAGVTPLHVAALLSADAREAMLLALSSFATATGKLWGVVQADDATTPEALAETAASGSRGSSSVSDASSTAAEQALKEFDTAAKGDPTSQEVAERFLPQRLQSRKSLRQVAKGRLNKVHVSGLVSEVMALSKGQTTTAAAVGDPLVMAALLAGALTAAVLYLMWLPA